jgi:hypothetical protein
MVEPLLSGTAPPKYPIRFDFSMVGFDGKSEKPMLIESENKSTKQFQGAHQTYFKCKSLKLKKVRIG